MIINALQLSLVGLMLMLPCMAAIWVLSKQINNAGIVDVFWGIGFILVFFAYALVGHGFDVAAVPIKLWILGAMLTLACLRLSYYLLKRFLKEHPKEDPRYTSFRDAWAAEGKADWMMFWLFELQGLLIVILCWPFALAVSKNIEGSGLNSMALNLTGLEIAGLTLWFIGFVGEAVADRQLQNFKANPENKGEVCQDGFWNYSRHPNYFFEWLIWCGYAVFALSLSAPLSWTALLAPALMFYILTQLTGIPLTEEQALKSRGEKYRRYQETTSPFIPWLKSKPKAG